MNIEETLTSYDPYHADIQSIIDSYVRSVDHLSPSKPSESSTYSLSKSQDQQDVCNLKKYLSTSPQNRHVAGRSTSSIITFDRDPAISEHLTDEFRWLLIQYGPYQPRDDEDHFVTSAKSSNNGKGLRRFRVKWFDDVRFSDWLEYSLTTCRAYCFYCRLFADSNRNRAFSRDGIKNWSKCLGSRGLKKKRSMGPSSDDIIGCQRRGLLESHAMSESHKQAYTKYRAFIDQRHKNDRSSDDAMLNSNDPNVLQDIKQENNM